MNLSELQREAVDCAIAKGWHESDEIGDDGYPTPRQRLAWLALVTDELDEAAIEKDELEYYDNGKPCGVISEYADAVIRILDMAGACGFDIASMYIPVDVQSVALARNTMVDAIRNGRNYQAAQLAVLVRSVIEELFVKYAVSPNDFERVLRTKMAYNRTRPIRHGGKLA